MKKAITILALSTCIVSIANALDFSISSIYVNENHKGHIWTEEKGIEFKVKDKFVTYYASYTLYDVFQKKGKSNVNIGLKFDFDKYPVGFSLDTYYRSQPKELWIFPSINIGNDKFRFGAGIYYNIAMEKDIAIGNKVYHIGKHVHSSGFIQGYVKLTKHIDLDIRYSIKSRWQKLDNNILSMQPSMLTIKLSYYWR